MIHNAAHPESTRLNAIEKAYRKITDWQQKYTTAAEDKNRKKWAKSVQILTRLDNLYSFYLY